MSDVRIFAMRGVFAGGFVGGTAVRLRRQMLKWEVPDLDFAGKSSIFVSAKEETVPVRRLPPFLGPACAQNYPALRKNYKGLGFIYVPDR